MCRDGKLSLISASIFPSREYSGLDQIVTKFLASSSLKPDRACFGVAGPVRNGRIETSNIPWIIEATKLAADTGLLDVQLINDLEANAWGIALLAPDDVVPLNPGKGQRGRESGSHVCRNRTRRSGNVLGWDAASHLRLRRGPCRFCAPQRAWKSNCFTTSIRRFGHVSYERIVSGPGLRQYLSFLKDTGRGEEPKWLAEEMLHHDPAATISKTALEGKSALCEQALDLFISVYGAEAGNLALKLMTMGGIYLGGGIAPKILSKLSGPLFMESFLGKGRMKPLMESMPVRVITNDKIALLGAARYAQAAPA